MLDLKFIRKNPEQVRAGMRAKNREIDLDQLLLLDTQLRNLQPQLEQLRARKNEISQKINQLRKTHPKVPSKYIDSVRKINESIQQKQQEISEKREALEAMLLRVPNLPHTAVPSGAAPAHNRILSTFGEIAETDFPLKPHWEIAEHLGMIDFNEGSRMAGSFFINFKGLAAKLNRALINFMLDLHGRDGYLEISPPYLARREMLQNTGQLPWLENDMYHLERDDLFLIPTGEIPLTNLHQHEILDAASLPLKYMASTPCFRREAGTHGRENRGLIRIHQFDKVELVQLVAPEKSGEALESLRHQAEKVLQKLALPYRVVELCAGELSFASARCYDLEVWAPGTGRYLEVSSCCNFEAFQARRANIRFRRADGRKPEFVHTLNASGVALPRTVVAILENYQTDEGTVLVPKVLQPYLGTSVLKSMK